MNTMMTSQKDNLTVRLSLEDDLNKEYFKEDNLIGNNFNLAKLELSLAQLSPNLFSL